jgi:DNA-binding XRE family transcriptional regulator
MQHKPDTENTVARIETIEPSVQEESSVEPRDQSESAGQNGPDRRDKEAASLPARAVADPSPVDRAAKAGPARNRLREIRLENMMSKAELARKAGLSVLTVTRIEDGFGCRMDTKRKILKALGLKVADRRKVFEDD